MIVKTNFFQRTFNITVILLTYSLLFLLITLGFKLLYDLMENIQSTYLSNLFATIRYWISQGEYYTKILSSLLSLISVALIIIELLLRSLYDTPVNYFKSAYQTIRLAQFLRQDENSQLAFSIDNSSTVTRFNPILRKFNRATSKCVVDVRKDSVTIVIKYPKTQQAQKLLRDMEAYIKEEISSRNPDYYFSAPDRKGNKLWFKSTKRY
ncbi:hypothetical protein [Streptococcus oralis]|jgi:hypothetical protein|uniref:hypothetical protein n=1 Tax=Streptococcus oralis TaxID=1303 RepID=UPI000A121DC6|nr:hypothetical protein [Streptococcus oralis]ORO84848.1 hypothetical protein B7704_02170 [Streptococcus oralis subsp. dentisani]